MVNGWKKQGIEKYILYLIIIASSIISGIFGLWYISVPSAFLCGILFYRLKGMKTEFKYKNETIFDESKVTGNFFVDEPVFEDRVVDPASLSFNQRKILSKIIAEDMYYQFLSEADLKDFEIVVSELKDSCGNKLVSKVKVTPPKTTMLTIPDNIRRKKMQTKPIANMVEHKKQEKITVASPDEIEVENVPDKKMDEISSGLDDDIDIEDEEIDDLPPVKPAIAFLDSKEGKEKPAPFTSTTEEAVKIASSIIKANGFEPAKLNPKIKIIPKPVKKVKLAPTPDDEDMKITSDDLKSIWDGEDDEDDELSPPIDPDLKASLKEVDFDDDDLEIL